ncbi:MAG: hypothetical protein EPO39_13825 [Candidatus Manganitrophaceae bacterium]|nr:MAG: hypothetical protein EPO39_13825 [Candidatus Manganitrophaceae bacterium]
MRRKAAAFIAFNAYLFCILSAFYNALPDLFRFDFRSPESPIGLRLEGPQWDYRYLSFLLLSLLATSIAAVLAGAIAQQRGGAAAAQSAIPLTLWWSEMFFIALFTGTIGFGAVSLGAIPLTVLISAYCGKWGERMQRELFPDSTIFGIYPYHFIWMVFPFFIYVVMTASWLPYLAGVLFQNWLEASFSRTLARALSLIFTLLPFVGMCALLYSVYKILNGTIFKIRSEWGRAGLSIGLLIVVPIILYRILLMIGRLMNLIPLGGI